MPRSTTTIHLGDERDDLDAELDELADEAADADDASMAAQEGLTVEQHLSAVEHAIEEYGADAAITLRELTPGERGRFVDRLEAAQEQAARKGYADGDGLRNIYFVAACLVDAPFLEDGETDYDDRVQTVSERPTPQLVDWLADRATEVNTLGNGPARSFAERVKASRQANEQS